MAYDVSYIKLHCYHLKNTSFIQLTVFKLITQTERALARFGCSACLVIPILFERFESYNLSVYVGGIGGFAAAQSRFGSFVSLIEAVFQVL